VGHDIRQASAAQWILAPPHQTQSIPIARICFAGHRIQVCLEQFADSHIRTRIDFGLFGRVRQRRKEPFHCFFMDKKKPRQIIDLPGFI